MKIMDKVHMRVHAAKEIDEDKKRDYVKLKRKVGRRPRKVPGALTSPGAPTMTAVPGYNITENTTVTFTCTGNVGKPPGQFQWYMYRGSIRENKTDLAATQSNSLATPSCTYTGRSSINITMTRMEQGIVMRCRVYHPTQGSNTNIEECIDPNTGFCRNGEKIFVSYPVSISLSPQSPVITADQGSESILTCNAEGYPPPQLRWYKNSDPNNTLGTNSTLKLQNLSLSDSGVYVCIGSNNINGAELNDSKQVEITVVRTTTPPPTTTSTKTTTNSKATTTASSGVTDPVKDSDKDNTAAIAAGVIVPVVVIIIIVIIVVCVCRRRAAKKSPVEEPPEKPFNNHSRINTISSRPDLVSSEKTYPAFDNSKAFVNEDGLTYAQLQLDNKPRSRRPLALDDSHTDYSDISMPQV
ncbi:hypothetical protein C0Q70_12329 [Pomacea canaliculata]|uniref:Ig-like domain-containing protein n=1 Tax=Pomacea canaliculata TaxID=400727 RepID=A0A2T7P183_POMCA|nr:hypothetical protein C0Q70_12329 [Pomacea canaliculata]